MKVNLIKNDLSGNPATLFTLSKIRNMINAYKVNPAVRVILKTALYQIDGREAEQVFKRLYEYSLKRIRYQKDILGVETIQSPLKSLAFGFGDCDDFTIFLGTLIEAAGYQTRIVLVSSNPEKIFNHVFIQAFSPKTGWISLDPVESYFGRGFKSITNAYIEGEGEKMQLLELHGLSGSGNDPYFSLNGLGSVYPVVMGDLGALKRIKKAVKKTVKKVAKPLANTALSVAASTVPGGSEALKLAKTAAGAVKSVSAVKSAVKQISPAAAQVLSRAAQAKVSIEKSISEIKAGALPENIKTEIIQKLEAQKKTEEKKAAAIQQAAEKAGKTFYLVHSGEIVLKNAAGRPVASVKPGANPAGRQGRLADEAKKALQVM